MSEIGDSVNNQQQQPAAVAPPPLHVLQQSLSSQGPTTKPSDQTLATSTTIEHGHGTGVGSTAQQTTPTVAATTSVSSTPPSPALHPAHHQGSSSHHKVPGKPFLREYYKTRMCRHVSSAGSCRFGARCIYAHTVDEMRPNVPGQGGGPGGMMGAAIGGGVTGQMIQQQQQQQGLPPGMNAAYSFVTTQGNPGGVSVQGVQGPGGVPQQILVSAVPFASPAAPAPTQYLPVQYATYDPSTMGAMQPNLQTSYVMALPAQHGNHPQGISVLAGGGQPQHPQAQPQHGGHQLQQLQQQMMHTPQGQTVFVPASQGNQGGGYMLYPNTF